MSERDDDLGRMIDLLGNILAELTEIRESLAKRTTEFCYPCGTEHELGKHVRRFDTR